jgi:spermidine/putrescine-binding protein
LVSNGIQCLNNPDYASMNMSISIAYFPFHTRYA